MKNLNQFRFNYTSQYGEDGIIEHICKKIGIKKGWCVEFGAWDGEHLSNTNHLFTKKGWSTILIESSDERFNALIEKFKDKGNVYLIKAHVGFQSNDPFRLTELLKQTPIPRDFDLLSIDVDGNDWYVWKSLNEYCPKIVIIEANSTFNWDIYFVGEPNSGLGASAQAITQLGKKKGYELVAHTGNCIFVKKEYFPLIGIKDNSLKLLFDDKWYRKAKNNNKIISKAVNKIGNYFLRLINYISRHI